MGKVGSNIVLIGIHSKDSASLLNIEFSKLALFVVARWLEGESLVNLRHRCILGFACIRLEAYALTWVRPCPARFMRALRTRDP